MPLPENRQLKHKYTNSMLAAKNLIKKTKHANSHRAFVAPTKIGLPL